MGKSAGTPARNSTDSGKQDTLHPTTIQTLHPTTIQNLEYLLLTGPFVLEVKRTVL